jgi:hypothetical protein
MVSAYVSVICDCTAPVVVSRETARSMGFPAPWRAFQPRRVLSQPHHAAAQHYQYSRQTAAKPRWTWLSRPSHRGFEKQPGRLTAPQGWLLLHLTPDRPAMQARLLEGGQEAVD